MDNRQIVGLAFIFGIVMGLFMIAYEDNAPYVLFKRLRCAIGWHKTHIKFGGIKIHKYYCGYCKRPRKKPPLKIIDGGNKIGNNKYNF